MYQMELDQLMHANMLDRELEAAALLLSKEARRGCARTGNSLNARKFSLALPKIGWAGHFHFTHHHLTHHTHHT